MRVCIPHSPVNGRGGPVSFQRRLVHRLTKMGIEIIYDLDDYPYDIAFIIGGTRKLFQLWHCKQKGIPIVQRLDGINWRHRVTSPNLRLRILPAIRNFLLKTIRNHLADHIIYQSQFAKRWWHEWHGPAPCPESIIYNAVDLSIFHPENTSKSIKKKMDMLCAEGNIHPDPTTIQILKDTHQNLFERKIINRTLIYGGILPQTVESLKKEKGINVEGPVPANDMPVIFQNAALYLSLDTNTACQNSVIEALASGVPVVGFDTGSLAELILPGGGTVVPYGADPWKLETPDISSLCTAAQEVMESQNEFSRGARMLAQERYDINKMVENYIEVFSNYAIRL